MCNSNYESVNNLNLSNNNNVSAISRQKTPVNDESQNQTQLNLLNDGQSKLYSGSQMNKSQKKKLL